MIRFMRAVRVAVLVGAFWAGVPMILFAIAGYPLPRRLPSAVAFETWVDEPFAPRYAWATARAFAWLVWAGVAGVLFAVALARLRHQSWKRFVSYLPGPVQGLVAAVVGATAVTTATSGLAAAAPPPTIAASAGVPAADGGPASAERTPVADTLVPTLAIGARAFGTPTAVHALTGGASSRLPVYTVAHGDRMVDVAERFLGDPSRYVEIARLNPTWEHHDARFPDHWEPGWRVVLPADAHWRAAGRHATGRLVVPAAPPTATPAPAHSTGTPRRPPDPSPHATDPVQTATPSTVRSPRADADGEHGVDIPGGWVGLPLAAVLVTAAAAVWRQRRYRYHMRPVDGAALSDADLRPLPAVVTRMRHAVRDGGLLESQPTRPQPTVAEYERVVANADQPDLPSAGPSGPDLAGFAARIPAGGLGLTGPGAEPAARALLIAALSTGSPDDPDARGQVVVPAETLAALLGAPATEIGPLPRLIVTASAAEAVLCVEEQLLERRRQLQEYDVADLPALRAATPYHPPIPPLLLLAEVPTPDLGTRLSTTVRLGAAVQISAVLLGEWAVGDTAVVQADGRLTPPDDQRLAILDAPTTRQMLQVLREAHTGQPPPPTDPPASRSSTRANPGPATAEPTSEGPAAWPTDNPAAPAGAPALDGPTPAVDSPDPTSSGNSTDPTQPVAGTTADLAGGPRDVSPARRARVRIRLLGDAVILDHDGATVPGLRLHARQLLVYLAVHRGGADLPEIMEAFWPDATMRRAGERLSTEVGQLRSLIRHAAGDRTLQPVINTGGRYILNADVLDVDLWHLSDALHRASAATDRADLIAALRDAVDAHTGDLAKGHDYDWLEQHREQARRHGVRARLHLARLIADSDPAQAARLSQSAADLDRFSEDAARHAMHSLARLGDRAGIRARLQKLRDALDEIDEEPSDDTLALVSRLQRQAPNDPRPQPPDYHGPRLVTTSPAPTGAPDQPDESA